MQSIHITTLRKILSSPEPIDIRLWTRSDEIQSWHRCISLKYDSNLAERLGYTYGVRMIYGPFNFVKEEFLSKLHFLQ